MALARNPAEALLAPLRRQLRRSAPPRCRLARMPGSGATCFALFKDCRSAARVEKAIRRAHPLWWAKTCVLS
ncbi:MAG TPA: hypothetical protein VIF02_01200 [Methylocella sp.]